MDTNSSLDTFVLQVDNGNIPYLNEAAKWGKFLAVMGFIFCGLMVLTGIFASTFLTTSLSQLDPGFREMGALGTGFFAVWFVLFALLYFFPSLYLFNFASQMQVAIRNNDQISLNNSFKNLKSCFKFWGILFIIILSIYALIIIFAIIGTAFMH